jgi:hypothetical protein
MCSCVDESRSSGDSTHTQRERDRGHFALRYMLDYPTTTERRPGLRLIPVRPVLPVLPLLPVPPLLPVVPVPL